MEPDRESTAPRRRKRLGLLVLVVGLALASGPWLRVGAEERTVSLELLDPTTIESLEIVWLEGDEVLRRSELRYPRHDAPRQVVQTLQLTDGSYRLQVRLGRSGGEQLLERRIDIGHGVSSITVPLR